MIFKGKLDFIISHIKAVHFLLEYRVGAVKTEKTKVLQ